MINTKENANSILGKKFIDLFAGIGGFRIAFESFGAKCVFSSEWNKFSQEVYESNFGEIPHGDITKIHEKDIPSHDILCAGFPCQAFSVSGKQLGFEDTRGTLFFDIARIVKHHKPNVLLLENVKNFERHDGGRTIQTVVTVLNKMGYDVYYKVLNASLFGIPQSRKRIFIWGFHERLGIKEYDFPVGTGEKVKLEDFLLSNGTIIEKCFLDIDDVKYKENYNIKPDLFGDYSQKPIRIGTINRGGQGERIYHVKGHAITLSAYGGGVAAKTGAYLVDSKVRKLDPRECARIMGFPDSFKIHSNPLQSWKQFGNGVVINVAQVLIKDIIEKNIV